MIERTALSRKIFRWIKIIILIYVAVGIALYTFQEKLLLHPQSHPQDYFYNFDVPFQEVDIQINKSEVLNLVQFFPQGSITKGVVLYFHGNMKNVEHYAKAAENFTQRGYEVWMPDYPGFGKTTGEMTEQKLYDEAMIVYRLANKNFAEDSIIIYGRSFGSGIASQLATRVKSKRLILETPYYSIPALFNYYAPVYPTGIMSKYNLPVNEYLQDVKVPITIFHGTKDWTIPYSSTERLKQFLQPKDEFITIEKGGHNNLAEYKLFQQKLDSILQSN